MEAMAEILEQELDEAVEVKNKKYFHRFILLLTQNVVSRNTHDRETDNLRSDIRDVIAVMERRFEAVDQRFESLQKQMDVRFNAVDKRFSMMFAFMSLGFTALAVLLTVFHYI